MYYYYATFNGSIWLKALYFFRMNRIVGPLLKIVGRMGKDIANFVIIIILTTFTFSCIGMILFDTLPEFASFHRSLFTLFSWMLGSFTFDTMSSFGLLG